MSRLIIVSSILICGLAACKSKELKKDSTASTGKPSFPNSEMAKIDASLDARSSLQLVGLSTVKIMPLGDSITYGMESVGATVNHGGYRAPLFQSLNNIYPAAIDFVGSARNTDFPNDPDGVDQDQEGHSGYTTESIAASITTWINAANPNIVLLMLGSNDVYNCFPWSKSEGYLNQILNASLANSSVRKVLVANVTPLIPDQSGCRTNATIEAYNANLKVWVMAKLKEAKPLQFVDMHDQAGLTRDDMSDTLHPNATGYVKIAKVWLNALSSVLSPRGDASADGRADIYWHNQTTNQNLIWILSNNRYSGTLALPSTEAGWEIATTADYNFDGVSDILLRNYTTGRNEIWFMSRDSQIKSKIEITPITDPSWRIVGSADMNGDGFPDIQWNHLGTNEVLTWAIGPGGVTLRSLPMPKLGAGWRVAGVADFNRDGYPDELLRSSNGENIIWFMGENGAVKLGEQAITNAGTEWTLGGVGDFNGDGWADIAWHNKNDLTNRLWLMKFANGAISFDNVEFDRSHTGWDIQGPK